MRLLVMSLGSSFLVQSNAWLLRFGQTQQRKLWKKCVEQRNTCPRMATNGQTCQKELKILGTMLICREQLHQL